MEVSRSLEEEVPLMANIEGETVAADTGSTRNQAAEVIREVAGIRIVKPSIRDRRYRQGV